MGRKVLETSAISTSYERLNTKKNWGIRGEATNANKETGRKDRNLTRFKNRNSGPLEQTAPDLFYDVNFSKLSKLSTG